MESWRACTCHNEPLVEDARAVPHCHRSGLPALVWWVVDMADDEVEVIRGIGAIGCQGLMWDECDDDARTEAFAAEQGWARIRKVIEREGVGPRKKKAVSVSLFP
jgi:hypothetical protein